MRTLPPLAPVGEPSGVLIDLSAPTDGAGRSHTVWAVAIARRISRWQGFVAGGQEEQDLECVAAYTLVRKVRQFAPRDVYGPGETADGHFRGWVHPSLRSECLREAKRIRGGGTFRTPPKAGEVHVEGLPTRVTDNGAEEVEIQDYREIMQDVDDEPGPSPTAADFLPARAGRIRRRWDTRTGEEIPAAPT